MARARCPRSSVEAGQKCITLKGARKSNFLLTFGCLPASTLKPEEREFVVDSGASMHMISKKDLSDAEMDTLTTSRSPTTVITANGEAQTHEEAQVYFKELDFFLTMKVREDTLAVLSLGKLCDEHGYSHEWINGQKPHLIKNGIRIQCNTENFVPIVVPGLSTSSSSSLPSSTHMTPSRQEIDHPTSSSSSSTSPTITSSQYERRFGKPFKGPIIPFGSLVEYYPVSAKDQSRIQRKSYLDYSLDTLCTRGEFRRVTYWLQTLRSWKRWTHQKSTLKDSMQRK